jgi:hypothetical protein
VQDFEQYLAALPEGKDLDEALPAELEGFVASIEQKPRTSAKKHLWALGYYYEYTSNEEMRNLTSALRQQRIKRTPFSLSNFRGVKPDHVERLADLGIRNVGHMLEAGQTPIARMELSEVAGVPSDAILELVKLSDLARVPGMKGIRARLYHDAGVDTIEKLAGWDADELHSLLSGFVERTAFDGIAPLPREVAFSVATAKRLPRLVEY